LALALPIALALAAPLATPSRASLVREGRDNDDTSKQLKPLEVVRAGLLKKRKSKQAHALKLAWDALSQKKYPQAIAQAGRVAEDPLFGDYGNWIVASARYGAGLKALASKAYGEAMRDAESSIASSFKIETKSPYSPMLKNLHRDVGLAEVLEGDAYASQKKWKQAERAFEQGLQRLSSGGTMGLVRPESLHRYAQACAVTKTEMCDAWILRFSFFFPKNSEEMRAITQVLPDASEHPRPAQVSKLTQSYKAPDLDQTAFELDLAQYLDGKFGTAIKGFQQFIDEYPKSPYRFRARYWLAQAMTQQQQHDKAQQAYETLQHDSPLTYYGLLAAFAAGSNARSCSRSKGRPSSPRWSSRSSNRATRFRARFSCTWRRWRPRRARTTRRSGS
jgi:tetratricopeptide (TPR) repeat protein